MTMYLHYSTAPSLSTPELTLLAPRSRTALGSRMYRCLDLTTTEGEIEWPELVFSQELYPAADQHTRRLSRNSACVYTHVKFTRGDKIETRHEIFTWVRTEILRA